VSRMTTIKGRAQRWEQSRWGIPALLVLVVGIVYANSFPGVFIFDDHSIVQNNSLLHPLDLVTILRSDYWGGFLHSGLYRPLTILSLGLNRLLFGPEPFGFHLVNVLLHAGVTILLFRMLRVWGVTSLAAGSAALLFAVHPLHLEVVDVVVGRSELLAALFLLAGFIVARRRNFWAAPLVCLCYLLALLSKEHAVTFLALLPLWETFAAGSPRIWKERWPLYAGLLTVAILWQLWICFGVIHSLPLFPLVEAVAPLAFVDGTTRVLTALHLQWIYLGKLLVPSGLQAVYSVADMPAFISSPFSLAGLLVTTATGGVLVLLAWGWRRRSPLALFGLFYCVAFLPTANLVFAIGVSMAERLTYFPAIWFCAGLGTLFAALGTASRRQRWGIAVLVGYLLMLGGMTMWRNRDYSNEVRLWSAEVVQNSQDFLGWQSLADSLLAAGNIEEGDQAYQWMLYFAPDYPAGLRGRTTFLLKQKRYAEALATAHKAFALSSKQNDAIGLAFDGLDLAEANLVLGECAQALSYLDGPSRIMRAQLQYVALRSATLSCLGRDAEAVDELANIDDSRLNGLLRYQYAKSLFRLGRIKEARSHLEKAVKGGEDDAAVWNLLGMVCTEMNEPEAAQAAFAKAVTLAPGAARYRENLQRVRWSDGKRR
jgi:protein O-mannosyl-transferase